MDSIENMTGENYYLRPPKSLQLNEVRFNGKDGVFLYVDNKGRKEGQKSEVTILGESIRFVFLKVRRRISGYNKKQEVFYTSTEHNTKEDVVYLYGAKEKGFADVLYNKYAPFVKAQRVVYAFLIREGFERELVRIIIKGATLNSGRESKVEGVEDFFDYLTKKQKGVHNYEYTTVATAVPEQGKLGKIYSIGFERRQKLNDDQIKVVIETITELHELSKEEDAYYKNESDVAIAKEVPKELPTIEYPEEDVNVEDIPF